MDKHRLVLEITFTDDRAHAAGRRSRLSTFLDGFTRAFNPASVEPASHYLRNDATAMRADLRSLSDGLAAQFSMRRTES